MGRKDHYNLSQEKAGKNLESTALLRHSMASRVSDQDQISGVLGYSLVTLLSIILLFPESKLEMKLC